ncbi:MAG: hypothetical protein E7201_11670 [Selenomonas ruminantium]|uniref:Uncharacterized protein n=1 Tax=Selenomonas ruminantium TaxID=971 RepID=A0A927ZTP7_SELRU|nr:hypothetical protein [Selenomonas ruminantium]
MRFLFVRPEICLHLPSDSTSRWTPLVFGYDLPATGLSRDFHPLECAHAGRTRNNPLMTFCHKGIIELSKQYSLVRLQRPIEIGSRSTTVYQKG